MEARPGKPARGRSAIAQACRLGSMNWSSEAVPGEQAVRCSMSPGRHRECRRETGRRNHQSQKARKLFGRICSGGTGRVVQPFGGLFKSWIGVLERRQSLSPESLSCLTTHVNAAACAPPPMAIEIAVTGCTSRLSVQPRKPPQSHETLCWPSSRSGKLRSGKYSRPNVSRRESRLDIVSETVGAINDCGRRAAARSRWGTTSQA